MIRELTPADSATAIEVAADCGLFTPEELEVLSERLDRALAGRGEQAEVWFAEFDGDGRALGVGYCAEEAMTDRVWNLLFIGVRGELQNAGHGTALLEFIESRLRDASQRMLVIETTNGPEFEPTQAFYRRRGYSEEGTVRDFYADGAHKIVFRKLL